MKTNELRIGNCILIDCIMYKEERKVTEICPDGVFAKTKYTANMPEIVFIKEEDIEPIELTEEVLLKIGFKKDERMSSILYYLDYEINEDEYIRVRYVIYNLNTLPLLRITSPTPIILESCELTKRGIRYLHELQNAYYLLTNEELNIEL